MERLKIKRDYTWISITNEAMEYIYELIGNLPFVPSGETYSFSKHYELHWVHRFADKLSQIFYLILISINRICIVYVKIHFQQIVSLSRSLFFEAPRNPFLNKNSEGREVLKD
ncbi:hypothetical protein Glove_21g188 [Diversispora epigaea]|uniref:Uncharacterized protein n=1 Tax=Diversispora epigaea TaxID=1348612 RepID=A0A397JU41_9GLOM|nr:hypothetical protein Glove_21g188 [Diversispora epigaea]